MGHQTDLAPVKVKLLRPGARLPVRGTEHATGFDLHAALESGPVALSQRPTLIPTGIAMEVPFGIDTEIRPRSGLARRGVLCTLGTLDADYRGELMVAMYTTAGDIEYAVEDGDRIAQLVFTVSARVALTLAEELTDSVRGAGGHGSTGR